MRHVAQGAQISVLVSLPPARKAPIAKKRELDWAVAVFWIFALFNVVAFWSVAGCIALGQRSWSIKILGTTGAMWIVASIGAFFYRRHGRNHTAACLG